MAPSDTIKPPTGQLIGYPDVVAYNQLGADYTEHIPALVFPESVYVYNQMRRDPQLAAVLMGITMPIRRASWAIDPTGCDPKVCARIADDMGLPLLGVDDPGPARTSGMSWPDHLRAALLSLVYGFFGFELLADVSSGQARLAGAYQRVPATISFIHSLPNGDFGGISQLYHPDTLQQAEIGPERMAWYAHDVEGSAWHGTSILRPGYSSWLIKQELRRVLAGSNKRWGMGVPTVRALPGTSPTPEQMAAAAQMAQSARAGETAGGSVPPGFVMEILGMSGSAPNTLEALRWVDQQMSGMVLSRWMDLGSSQTGSRALGESFIDTFLLSITSIAEFIADVATRQIVARLVAWNEGLSEPVPRIVVSDVGTRHEVTADALAALLASGALQADPALEEWVRRTYRLPQRDPSVPWQRPTVGKGSAPKGGDGSVTDAMSLAAAGSVKAAARPRARRSADGQLALPIAAADGEPALLGEPQQPDNGTGDQSDEDEADRQDAEAQQAAWAAATAALLAQWPSIAQPMVDDLADQAADATTHNNLAKLAGIVVSSTVLAGIVSALTPPFVGLAAEAVEHVLHDATGHGVTVRRPAGAGAKRAGQAAALTANLIATGYAQAATRKALQVAGGSADEVRAAVGDALLEMGRTPTGMAAGQLAAGLSSAQAAGRQAVYQAAGKQIVGYRAVEHNDDPNLCKPCHDIRGTVFSTMEEMEAAYGGAGGYAGCLGGVRCRGYARAIWA